MLLEVIQPLRPRLNTHVGKRDNFSTEATPEVDLAFGVDVAVVDPRSAIFALN